MSKRIVKVAFIIFCIIGMISGCDIAMQIAVDPIIAVLGLVVALFFCVALISMIIEKVEL